MAPFLLLPFIECPLLSALATIPHYHTARQPPPSSRFPRLVCGQVMGGDGHHPDPPKYEREDGLRHYYDAIILGTSLTEAILAA